MPDGRPTKSWGVSQQTAAFTVLWAVAHLGHILRKSSPGDPLAWLWLIAAVALLVRPGAPIRIAVLALAQLLYLASKLPLTDNHAYIMGFVDLGLLVAVALPPRRPFVLPTRYLAATLVLSYGAAALSKLNRGFFDPSTSCAVEMFYEATGFFGLRSGALPAVEPWLPYGIAMVELLVPLSLVIPATRRAGVILVVVFHWAMSLSPTATALDFTLILFALAFLFLPVEAAAELTRRFDAVRSRLPGPLRGGIFPVALLAAFLTAAMLRGPDGFPDNRNWIWLAGAAVTIGALLVALAVSVPGSAGGRVPRPVAGGRWQTTLFATLIVLQVLNVSAPYLGLKTVGSYVMYSNLQTEMGVSNHFFLPRLPVETGLDDFVEIVASSNPALRQARARGDLVSWHELRRILTWNPGASVSYRRDGVLHEHEQAREDGRLVHRDLLMHKLIGHRAYNPREARCRW